MDEEYNIYLNFPILFMTNYSFNPYIEFVNNVNRLRLLIDSIEVLTIPYKEGII